MNAPDLISPEILKAYYPGGIAHQALIEGGEINLTFLITAPAGQKTILQRLSRIYNESLTQDYETVSSHLTGLGWEMATMLTAQDGRSCVRDHSGRLWRSFDYIDSQPGSERQGDWSASIALADLLGKLHAALAKLNYRPRFAVAHSNDVPHHARRLQEITPKLKDSAQRELAATMIAASKKSHIDVKPSQLIHGDPRVGNTLFKDGVPCIFIDWDGLKIANPLVDVGDMLQSVLNELGPRALADFSIVQLDPLLRAYHQAAGLTIPETVFREKALAAGQRIALDLGIRQLIDTVEDYYFSPPNQLESRYAFNARRAGEQWKVYQALRP